MREGTRRHAPDTPASRLVVSVPCLRVAPTLIGAPLARPRQRLLALIADLVLLTAITHGNGLMSTIALGCAAYLLLFTRTPHERWYRRIDGGLRGVCVLLVLALLVAELRPVWEYAATGPVPADASEGTGPVDAAAAIETLYACEDDECRQSAGAALARGLSPDGHDGAAAIAAVDAIARQLVEQPARADRIVGAARAALAARQIAQPPTGRRTTVERPEQADAWAFSMPFLFAAFYFSALPTLRNGVTPGKRLLGLRIVHLAGRPLRLWDGLLRFGGYFAGLATGMLGFLQIYLDPNRQGIHDRLAFTTVLSEATAHPG